MLMDMKRTSMLQSQGPSGHANGGKSGGNQMSGTSRIDRVPHIRFCLHHCECCTCMNQ
jgi:hypothetical protein